MSNCEFNPQWIERARNGDQDAISEIYTYCYQSVYLTAKSMIKGDLHTAEDILQDAFIKALTSLDQLGDDSKFPVWIKAIARNKAMDWLRRNQKLRFESIENEDEDTPDMQLEDDSVNLMPEVQLDQQETARMIQEILDSLSDGQRMAISMYYYQDMSIKEIAQAVGCSIGTVKAQLHNGRKKIEEKVRELEKQGTKLYGLMPFPFFMWLFRSMDNSTMLPDAAGLASLMQHIGIGAAAQHTAKGASSTSVSIAETAQNTGIGTVGNAAEHAAKTVGAAAGHAAKGKIIAGVLAVAVIGGGAVYVSQMDSDDPVQPAITEENQIENPEQADEKEVYHDLLLSLQDNGTFLQYAHMEDLNGDGTDDLMLVHDDDQFSLYEIKDGTATDVFDFQFENTAIENLADEAGGKTWKQLVTDSENDPTLLLSINREEDVITFWSCCAGSWIETTSQLSYENGDWNLINYKVPEPSGEGIQYYIDGTEVTEEEYNASYKDTGEWLTKDNIDDVCKDQLDEILTGKQPSEKTETYATVPKEVRTAYATLLKEHIAEIPARDDMSISVDPPVFQLVYIDGDDIPELAIADEGTFAAGVTLYTYINGHVQLLGEKLGSNGTIYYKERENQILCTINKDFGDAYEYEIINGVLVAKRHSTMQMDTQRNLSFTIDGEDVSQEEGEAFWDTTEYETIGNDAEEACLLDEATIASVLE